MLAITSLLRAVADGVVSSPLVYSGIRRFSRLLPACYVMMNTRAGAVGNKVWLRIAHFSGVTLDPTSERL